MQFIHGSGLLFASVTSDFRANHISGDILGGAMEPAGQDRTIDQLARTLRERNKYPLRHVLRQVRVANHAQGCRIDEVHVPACQFIKRGF